MTCVPDFRGSYSEGSCNGSCVLDPARLGNTHVGDCQAVDVQSVFE